MFQFLFGVAIGAAGYWAWQSFGRDLMGMGDQGETTYGGFSSSSGMTTGTGTSGGTTPTPSSTGSTGSMGTSSSGTTGTSTGSGSS